jgi:hypothetical protein
LALAQQRFIDKAGEVIAAGADPDTPAGDVGALLTIEGAAREIGCSRETLRRGLRELGLETNRGTLFNLRQIFRALSSDAKAERARVDRERADKLARERMVDERELFPRDDVLAFVNAVFLPVRQSILEMPPALCQRVNSADPEHAYSVLMEWADEFLAAQRSTVETATGQLARK